MNAPLLRPFVLFSVLLTATLPAQTPVVHHAQLNAAVEALFDPQLASGAAVVVVKDGKVVFLRGIGKQATDSEREVSPDSVFYIASSTKSFFGLAAALLHADGVVDLDAPITRWLPADGFHPDIDVAKVTLRTLLNHTHGIANQGPLTYRLAFSGEHTPAVLRRLLREHGPANSGNDFSYGNIGFNVAALAIENAVGKTWQEIVHDRVLKPLGMTSTSPWASKVDPVLRVAPTMLSADGRLTLPFGKHDGNMQSAGGLMTTAADLGKWLQLQMGGSEVMPAKVIDEVHRGTTEFEDRPFGPFGRTGYGIGWFRGECDGELCVHHFGGFNGFHSHISFLPEHGIGVAVLVNDAETGARLGIATAMACYDVLLERADAGHRLADSKERLDALVADSRDARAADRERRAKRPQDHGRPIADFVGTYTSESWGTLTMTMSDGRLQARIGHAVGAVEVFAPRQLRIELFGQGAVAQFAFDGDEGPAQRVTYRGNMVFDRVDPARR